MIEGHGDDLFRYGDRVKTNFSTNIPQTVDHSGLIAHLSLRSGIISSYPEPQPYSVECRLARIHDVLPENIIVTNGATEAIYLLAQAYMGGRSSIIVPTFREYQDACRIFNHTLSFVSSLGEISGNETMVWLCNPNNPTGKVFRRKRLLEFIDLHPDIIFIVDQAYERYSVKDVLSVDDVVTRPNVVMLHSLTKQFMVPGLRIGYAVGACGLINKIRYLKMPWSVNSIAIEASHYLLGNSHNYIIDLDSLHSEVLRVAGEFRRLGISVEDTDCNFFLANLPDRTASELKDWLVDKHGLLIRDASNFESLSERHFRIAAQTATENDLLIEAIEEWISLS